MQSNQVRLPMISSNIPCSSFPVTFPCTATCSLFPATCNCHDFLPHDSVSLMREAKQIQGIKRLDRGADLEQAPNA